MPDLRLKGEVGNFEFPYGDVRIEPDLSGSSISPHADDR